MIIPLFFSDFKRFVTSERFKGEMEHPVFYYESDVGITFYKPVGSFIYSTSMFKNELPEDITLPVLKSNFNAIELPAPLNTSSRISIEGSLN